jgi:glycosyltransferase involved in cell wall biosynthesis
MPQESPRVRLVTADCGFFGGRFGQQEGASQGMPQRNVPKAKHILAFAQSLKGGGVERALLRLAGGWQRAGRKVTLVIGSTGGPLSHELPAGVEVIELGTAHYGALLRALPGIVRAQHPDILFCPGNHYTSAAGYARLRLGRACPPIVAKVSNALVRPDYGAIPAWSYRRWLGLHRWFLDQVVAMTPATAAEAMHEMHLGGDRVSVIPNPPAQPIPGAAPTPVPPGRFVLGVGRLEPQKRWERLIAAMPRIADRDVTLTILGEGSLRGALEAQVAALGLGTRVFLPGHAGDPLPLIKAASVLALTSDFEGVPGVLREALALGTPVVATDSSVSVREIVHSPLLGSVVARDDGDALVAALDHWLAAGTRRPQPTTAKGGDPAADYLALFDRVVAQRAA